MRRGFKRTPWIPSGPATGISSLFILQQFAELELPSSYIGQTMRKGCLSNERNATFSTCRRSYLVGLDSKALVWASTYFYTLCMRGVEALVRLRVMLRFAWVFVARRCDNYQFPMCWLSYDGFAYDSNMLLQKHQVDLLIKNGPFSVWNRSSVYRQTWVRLSGTCT